MNSTNFMRIFRVISLVLLLFCVWCSRGTAADPSFAREILPLLSNKCFVCHGPDSQEDDMLRLDSFSSATADRGGYKAIDPMAPAKSELLKRIDSADDPMPPADAEKQLTDRERQLLRKWIQSGGRYEKHWAFVVPKKAEPTTQTSKTGNPVDGFLRDQLQSRGIDFAPTAKPHVLARRAALVLTGLPPEPDQLQRFLANPNAAGYEKYVDELLASPRFGEHQARYWLDAVRYGDTHGLHLDNKRGIFPYRDWVVRAFNDNLPLNEFVTQQLAGDLMPQPTVSKLVATGYVRMNPSTGEGGAIAAEFQAKNNFDRVETFGTVFLGMSLTCARCHTHKYDPIPQTEYYRLMAFFNSTAEPALDRNKYDYGPTVRAPVHQTDWDALIAWQKLADQLLDEVTSRPEFQKLPANQQTALKNADTHSRLQKLADRNGAFGKTPQHKTALILLDEFSKLDKRFTTTLIAKDLPKPRETKLLRRGEYNLPVGDPLQPGILTVMSQFPADAPRNRLGLAKWLTSREHPLVSRVLMNRIWQRTFGDGLVRTPEDFGLQGQQPTHPQLLDWLAVELQDSGWNLKHMLRLLVTSDAFRQSSRWRDDVDDPENRLFARGPSWRLDAEVLRDLALWTSDLLDPQMGGEGVKPYQPSGMWQALAHPASNTKKYERDKGEKLYRRSLYVYWKRTSPHPMMTLFDAPDRESSCVRRSRSNTSLQSLGLLNETQRIEMARRLAERLLKEHKTDADRLDAVFMMLACRSCEPSERQACEDLLREMRRRYGSRPADAKALISHGEASRDESIPVEELAAWTQVSATILASDIALLLY